MTTGANKPALRSRVLFETLESSQTDRLKTSFVVDLRRDPRFGTDFPAVVTTESGEYREGRITNVSRSGLRIEVDRQTVLALIAERDRQMLEFDSSASFDVHFSVSTTSSAPVPVKARCEIVYTRHAEAEIFQVGMKFVTVAEGRTALDRYLWHRSATR